MKTILAILFLCSVAVSQQAAPAQSSKHDGDTMLIRKAATDADVCPPNCSRTLRVNETVSGRFDVFNGDTCGDLSINLRGKTAVTIHCKDGSVTYGKGFDKDSAAKAFWEAVSEVFTTCKAGAKPAAIGKPDSEKPEKKLP